MSLDLGHPSLELAFAETPLSIVQFTPIQAIPRPLLDALVQENAPSFFSITRTRAETSIIAEKALIDRLYSPSNTSSDSPDIPHENSGPWRALVVKGPMDLSLTGILHALTGPLKDAGVPVFASSTWDTDYVLINEDKQEDARKALLAAGWRFSP
ncbi:ACT domain-containing protein [Sporobolomyces koalae]|uniref:ACT domain-containing protein n=1 Tax=Sporobolomyces koalae TaxID=500713 RepID=UPI00317C92BD